LNMLKQQIRNQQESIVRLKESVLRARNANKFKNNDEMKYDEMDQENDDIMSMHSEQYVRQLQDDMIMSEEYGVRQLQDDMIMDPSEVWLGQIVDDVIKKYDVLDFQTSPIGAKRNIYIDKKFTKAWMGYVSPKFTDDARFYYWLDYTTAMQMCQRYSKQYINKQTRKFMIAIVNYELRDIHNNILYGIIICDEDKIEKKNDKYPYKLKTLMTKEQIRNEYGINSNDLPMRSRKHKEFINKLLLKRRITKQDLSKINWSNLKLFKSQSSGNNNDPINKSITMTQKVMKEYTQIALERLNASNDNNNNKHLIPIMVIDKQHNYYGIEWVLIVHIVHRNCDVGISFKYDINTNTFIATAIYLDRGEIESKHKLIGLKYDYCKNLKPFSIRKLKFKSGRHEIIDGDDDCIQNDEMNRLRRDALMYKRRFEEMQRNNQQYQRSMQNNAQVYMQEINSLKQQNQQFINQIVMMQHQNNMNQNMNQNNMNQGQFQEYNAYH